MMSSTISTCAAGDVGVEVLEDPHDAGGLGAGAVRRDRHPVHLDVPAEAPGQVGHHHHGAPAARRPAAGPCPRSRARSRRPARRSRYWICSSVKSTFTRSPSMCDSSMAPASHSGQGVARPGRRKHSSPPSRTRWRCPGRSTCCCPRQSETSRSIDSTCTRNSSPGGEPARTRRPAQQPVPQRGGQGRQPAGVQGEVVGAAHVRPRRVGQLVERRGVVAQRVRRPGQRTPPAGASARALRRYREGKRRLRGSSRAVGGCRPQDPDRQRSTSGIRKAPVSPPAATSATQKWGHRSRRLHYLSTNREDFGGVVRTVADWISGGKRRLDNDL